MDKTYCVRFECVLEAGTYLGPEWAYYPNFLSDGTVGVDLRAAINKPITIRPMSSHSFSTGLRLHMPNDIKAEIRGRSGLAFHHNIIAFNGLIDQNYNKPIKVLLFNLGYEYYTVIPNERIGQLIFSKHQIIKFLPLRQVCNHTKNGEIKEQTNSELKTENYMELKTEDFDSTDCEDIKKESNKKFKKEGFGSTDSEEIKEESNTEFIKEGFGSTGRI